MNRNNERRFSQIPKMNTSRSKFVRKQDVKFTMDAGKLVPFYVDEVLPGDTFSVDTAGICRMSTPIYPVMDNCYLDVYYFYTPMRILWRHAKEFFGENNTTAWTQTTEYSIPKLILKGNSKWGDADFPRESGIIDYMGIPTKFYKANDETKEVKINALPIRAYIKIWNEWFRDQNIDNPAIFKDDDENIQYRDSGDTAEIEKDKILEEAQKGGRTLWVNKFHDYFTSALPSPQKGEPTLIPMSGNAPVGIYKNKELTELIKENTYFWTTGNEAATAGTLGQGTRGGTNLWISTNAKQPENISAYLGANLSEVTGATINNLRQAFAIQQFMEADARGGTRYREIISNHFGVYIDDKTIQIPEYLGGQRYMINVSQVVQTSATDTTSPQGNAAAISVTPFTENSFTKSFQEHGYVIGVCCIRNDNTYQQGIERMWSRTEKYDFYWPEFAHLGEQAVLNKEIFVQGAADDEKAFGYQEAYAEYRYKPNTTKPIQPQFIVDMLITNESVRPMPIYGTPGLTKL
jgi:hypothetical protein